MRKTKRRWIAGALALALAGTSVSPASLLTGLAAGNYQPGDSILAGTENMPAYCIDSFELLGEAGGIMGGVGEEYTCVQPSSRLSGGECALLFWAALSMLADKSEGTSCRTVLQKINEGAQAAGLTPITKHVTEQDLKKLVHLKSVRDKYPWLAAVTANEEKYMQLGGLAGGSGGVSAGGKGIPAVLQGHTAIGSALAVDPNTLTISFDPSGADREFIEKVPIQYSATGGDPWSGTPPAGWSCRKTENAVIFSNSNPTPTQLAVRFDPSGTEFQCGGGYQSPGEMYDRAMQLWVCTRCSNLHVYHSHREMPLESHQRMVNLQLEAPTEQYYVTVAGAPGQAGGQQGGIQFQVYRHEEDMTATYNLQLDKYDHETGKPLEQAAFKLYERFDDQDRIDRDEDGAAHIYEGGEPYQSFHKDTPVIWEDFRFVSGLVTDADGHAEKTVNHGYHYDKTFCDGHPAPSFVSVPEEEIDDETGEVVNESEIEAAQAENVRLAQTWLDCFSSCEEKGNGEFSGVHFHWLMGEVDQGQIGNISGVGGSPGETPDGGRTSSASPEEAYPASGCQEDCEETYERFISLRYSYAIQESSARPGYILHGIHTDDLPIEVITTDASEHGANAEFAGEYGDGITVNDSAAAAEKPERAEAAEIAEAAGAAGVVQMKHAVSAWMEGTEISRVDDAGIAGTDDAGIARSDDRVSVQPEAADESGGSVRKKLTGFLWRLIRMVFLEREEALEEPADEEEELIDDVTVNGADGANKADAANKVDTADKADATDEAGAADVANKTDREDKAAATPSDAASSGMSRRNTRRSEATPSDAASFGISRSNTAGSGVVQWNAVRQKATPSDTAGKEAVWSDAGGEVVRSDASWWSATPSNAAQTQVDVPVLSIADGQKRAQRSARSGGAAESTLFVGAYQMALNGASSGQETETGPADCYSHCNDRDGEGDAWRIYDHRTEGELHINKRDMELQAGESEKYDPYGDAQGDGTMEGAVYGLFAAADIVHPDGKTGVVYRVNQLVAVAATDRDGNASFTANTEAPGYFYDYEKGGITKTADGWAEKAPGNLYTAVQALDDYTDDGNYVRTYPDYQSENGNCWIGGPLLMGNYYVKELTRSEGYELSIGNRDSRLTNRGQDVTAALPTGVGYAGIAGQLYAEGQISADPTGEYNDPDINELFFRAESRQTGEKGFDLVFQGLPKGAKLYRLDTGSDVKEAEVGTGRYEKVYLTRPDGSPEYVVAQNDGQYPRYTEDGTLMKEEVAVGLRTGLFPVKQAEPFDTAKLQEIVLAEEPLLTQEEVIAELQKEFGEDSELFLKTKVERALRACGRSTPTYYNEGKAYYSAIGEGVYNEGVREDEAEDTVFGMPLVTMELPGCDEEENPVRIGDAILSVLDYYVENDFYSFGGVHEVSREADRYRIALYAGFKGNPAEYLVNGYGGEDADAIFHRVEYLPDDPAESPRYLYAVYTDSPDPEAFGSFVDYREQLTGSTVFASAYLVPDVRAEGDGTLVGCTETRQVYYQAGEVPCDENGDPIQAFRYQEQTETVSWQTETGRWVELPVREKDGITLTHMESEFTDSAGVSHKDDTLQEYELRVVLPEWERILTQQDLEQMYDASGWSAGDRMGSASYYLHVAHAGVRAYLDYENLQITGDGSFVRQAELAWPGQQFIWQDGTGTPGDGTRKEPVEVQERVIRQQMKVTKTLDQDSVREHDTYGAVHEDWWTKLFGSLGKTGTPAYKTDNFRFKTYLKSNLERLYRDEKGNVTWTDRNGDLTDPLAGRQVYPALVRKIYTKVSYSSELPYETLEGSALANTELYSFKGGQICEEQNPGYTAVLETELRRVEDESGTRMVNVYNYEKFMDALSVANHDKWDDCAPTFTSWQPIGNRANHIPETLENTKASDAVRQFAIDWYLDAEVSKLVGEPGDGTAARETQPTDGEPGDGTAVRKTQPTDGQTADVETAGRQMNGEQTADGDTADEQAADDGSTDEKTAGRGRVDRVRYTDELYDRALRHAIIKAENYLKPFFTYDLDEIYAILWDSEPEGGKDRDLSTLSADVLWGSEDRSAADGYYYGVSAYLPYGTYIVAEQQPQYEALADFKNRHYQIEPPREVALPMVYESYRGSQQDPEVKNAYYNYDVDLSQAELECRYQIRFNEENHAIQAHAAHGDYQIFKYGSDIDRKISVGSVSEHAGVADDVAFYDAAAAGEKGNRENGTGIYYRDQVRTMRGVLTAYDGCFAPMLVPYSVLAPSGAEAEETETIPSETGESSYVGDCYAKFCNRLYAAKLRIEKLDSETHENILHEEAQFHIYAAKRDDSTDGGGAVCFYSEPTMIAGTKEFLEDMGAEDIRPMRRSAGFLDRLLNRTPEMPLGPGIRCTGVVPEGTPVCEEAEQIILDGTAVFSTQKDLKSGRQTVGYLETPRPLGAGCYVLCECRPPAGYVRSKPVAMEIYSDKVTYYKEGNKDERVLTAIYAYRADGEQEADDGTGDCQPTARINAENTPIRLKVEKVKESSAETAETTPDKTVTYRVSGRKDGNLTELGNDPDYVCAYRNGEYLGYAWKKGTLEYLLSRKHAGEQVELVYEGEAFAGYGYVTRTLETADDENPYVVGALMTLFEARELRKSGDTEDHAYEGLAIERDYWNHVTRMYLKEERKEAQETGQKQKETDILYYDLSDLSIEAKEGSVYAWKDGAAYLEFAGGNLTKLVYHPKDKNISADAETKIYHLDRAGNRDALVDPYTGMAYVAEQLPDENGNEAEHIFVWPVHVRRDEQGNAVSRDKIATSRIATVEEGEDEQGIETGFITGIWTQEASLPDGNGDFLKEMVPIYDEHGLAVCYPASGETYEKGTDLYDEDGKFVRHQDSDHLEAYNQAAYRIQEDSQLHDAAETEENPKRSPLYHRQGENYIQENTWRSSDGTPNDPFHDRVTDGQPDILKRVPEGVYILEELRAPAGYRKGIPVGVCVRETSELQETKMVDQTTKFEIAKLDGTGTQQHEVLVMKGAEVPAMTVDHSNYGYGMVEGAELALFAAERVVTSDPEHFPNGYYLRKTGTEPLTYHSTNSRAGAPELLTARWTTGSTPIYVEGIPEGSYILEELKTPDGFVTAAPVEVEITGGRDVHSIVMYDDHTKVEVEKYALDGNKKEPVDGAGFTLYSFADGQKGEPIISWVSRGAEYYRGFVTAFEEMYRNYGCQPGTSVCWQGAGKLRKASFVSAEISEPGTKHPVSAVLLFATEEGEQIRIAVYGEQGKRSGVDFTYEYQFDYQKLTRVNAYAASWLTLDGRQRIDYLPAGSSYVLAEERTPEGYAKAEDTLIHITDTEDVLHYGIENQEGRLLVSKKVKTSDGVCAGELAGAHMALYRAETDGTLAQDEAHLVTDWITGTDGRYTETDRQNGRIPDGFQEGDLRLHQIRRLENGIYWLVELSCPPYYTRMEPRQIEYDRLGEIMTVQVENIPVTGTVTVKKTDEKGGMLKGVTYELSAYLGGDAHSPVFQRQLADRNGVVKARNLPVGEQQENGEILPYTYRLKELIPPEGYAVNTEIFRWQFSPDQNHVSYERDSQAEHEITVQDQKTNIVIGKRDFGQPDEALDGAEFAVYRVTGRDDADALSYDAEHPFDVWVTRRGEPDHAVIGMTAGCSYLLKERKAPTGYQKMQPVLFTLSADGRRIAQLGNELDSVTVHVAGNDPESGTPDAAENTDADRNEIESVTIRGRYAVKTEYELRDVDGSEIISWTGTEGECSLERETAAELGLKEGSLYTIRERSCYSDGTRLSSGTWTRRLIFDDAGEWRVPVRTVLAVTLSLEADDGTALGSFRPTEYEAERNIKNRFNGESNTSGETVFRKGGNYLLREVTAYSDGTEEESNRLGFCLDDELLVKKLLAFDRKTKVILSKTEITGEEELPGNEMCLRDCEGEVLDTWISGGTPHEIEEILEAGETYVLEETCPRQGYSYAEKIEFTVSGEGAAEHVVMENDRTRVLIRKEDEETGEALSGAEFQIRDASGQILYTWISEKTEEYHPVIGILTAGETYVLHEEQAPSGYERAEDITFTVPTGQETRKVTVRDRKKPKPGGSGGSDTPRQPEKPVVRKIGTISAVYHPGMAGSWAAGGKYRDGWLRFLPSLGDRSARGLMLAVFILSAAGVGSILYSDRRKKRGKGGKGQK